MRNIKKAYNKVYDFTNENISCLKDLYHFEKARVLSIVGSGDQFFASILNGAKYVDLVDINPTSYLYLILKFFAIRELSYKEFYEFMVLKKFGNIYIYLKLESVLPIEVLKYYKYLIENNKKYIYNYSCFRNDGIDLLCKQNQKYYFDNDKTVIPYFKREKYYELQEKLKKIKLPNFHQTNIVDLKNKIGGNYDIILMSNVYNSLFMSLDEYTELLKNFDSPEIQACYDWNAWYLRIFESKNYLVDKVLPSSPQEYNENCNYIYSLKK